MRHGIVAELGTVDSLLSVVDALRKLGYERLDAFTPYVVPELEELLGLRRTRLTWIPSAAGFVGAGVAYLVQWLCNAVWYPLNVGGRPPHSAPAFMIITFVSGILCAGTVGLITFVEYARLPWLANPIFAAHGFDRASLDRFWISVDASDENYDPERTPRELHQLGAGRIQYVSPDETRHWEPG